MAPFCACEGGVGIRVHTLLLVLLCTAASCSAANCETTRFYCNSTLWACLRGIEDKCGCLAAHWTCVEAAQCVNAVVASECAMHTRQLRCAIYTCPQETAREESGSGWIIALSLFCASFAALLALVGFIVWRRHWYVPVWTRATDTIRHTKLLHLHPKAPPLPLQQVVVLPEDAEIADMISVAAPIRLALVKDPARAYSPKYVLGVENTNSAAQKPPGIVEADKALASAKSTLDDVSTLAAETQAQIDSMKLSIADLLVQEKEKLVLRLAVGEQAAAALERERSPEACPHPRDSPNVKSRAVPAYIPVPASRITINAHGEACAPKNPIEVLLGRRVAGGAAAGDGGDSPSPTNDRRYHRSPMRCEFAERETREQEWVSGGPSRTLLSYSAAAQPRSSPSATRSVPAFVPMAAKRPPSPPIGEPPRLRRTDFALY